MGQSTSKRSTSSNLLTSEEVVLLENLFKSMSRSSGSIKREDIFKHWSIHLDETLLQFVVRFLCREPGKKVSAVNSESFGRLYVYTVRGRPEEKTSLIFNGYSEEDPGCEIPIISFLQYLQATINSYLTLQKNCANANFFSWSSIGCTVNKHRINLRSRTLCADLVNAGGEFVTADQVEVWFRQDEIFNSIQSHVFQCLFLISQKKGDKNTPNKINQLNLLPLCKGLENIPHFPSILGLGDVLFLNLSLPHDLRNEWRFLFSSLVHGESFSTMLGRIQMQGATIIILQDTDDHVFGGFASDNWTLSPNFAGNSSCFLFQLEPEILTFSATVYNNHYQYLNLHQQTMPNGLLMGGQLEFPGLWLDCEYGTGASSVSCTTFQNYKQLSKNQQFQLKHCEVWGVGPPPKNDEEENTRSVLDRDSTTKVILQMAGKKLYSEGLRDKKD